MTIGLDAAWLFGTYLMACRLAGVFLLSPVLGFATLPAMIRVVFVVLFAALLSAPDGLQLPAAGLSAGSLIILSLAALLQGALVGGVLRLAVAAFGLGGQLVDFQIGLNAAATLDPSTRIQNSLISTAFEMTGLVAFLALDLHHELLRGLAMLFQFHGAAGPDMSGILPLVVAQFRYTLIYGFALVAPVVLGLLLVDIAIAVASRSMPQINIYFVSLPLKVFVGLFLMALSVDYVGPLSARIFGAALELLRLPTH